MIVIGLTGKAGAGKSTVADYLVEKHGFTKLSFAGPLKTMLRTLDPILYTSSAGAVYRLSWCDSRGFDEARIKAEFPEYRRLLQALGTDCIRAVDEDFWVRAAMKELTDPNGLYVFDDVRFPNEAEAVLSTDGIKGVWRIDRPDHDGGAGEHESETHAGEMGETATFLNAGRMSDLHDSIAASVAHHIWGIPRAQFREEAAA